MKRLIKKAAIGMVAFFVVAASGPVFAAVGDQGVEIGDKHIEVMVRQMLRDRKSVV